MHSSLRCNQDTQLDGGGPCPSLQQGWTYCPHPGGLQLPVKPGWQQSPVFNLSITHERYGSSSHPLKNGHLTHLQDINSHLHVVEQRKVNISRQQYADNQNTSFLPAIVSTSTRIHGEFLRLLFLQSHSLRGGPGMMQSTETLSSPSTRVTADELGPSTTYCLRDLEDCLWCLSVSP